MCIRDSAYPGTALWLDDVHLSGGDVGVSPVHAMTRTAVYPNPAHDLIRFNLPSSKVMLYDGQGCVVRSSGPVSYTHLRAHETVLDIVCRLLLEKKK